MVVAKIETINLGQLSFTLIPPAPSCGVPIALYFVLVGFALHSKPRNDRAFGLHASIGWKLN